MNILLAAVNAKYIHSNLAVYSLKASAGKYEPLVRLAEYTINQTEDEIFRSVCRQKPQLLFFSCYIWNRRVILETAANVRKVLPDVTIWAGGPEVSYDARMILQENPAFDGVMTGEGERTFRRLLEYYVDGVGALKEIPGVVYREGGSGTAAEKEAAGAADCEAGSDTAAEKEAAGAADCEAGSGTAAEKEAAGAADREAGSDTAAEKKVPAESAHSGGRIVDTGSAPLMESLDELPFVYSHLTDFENRIIYYESSRGCPFSCSYCLSSIDKRVRFRSTELVKRELAFFLEHRVPQVKFVDRTFNCSHAHAMEIWRFIRDHDNGVTNFHFEIEADLLTEEELALLAGMRPGLVQLEIGVQTVNERTLAAIRRTAKYERIAQRVQSIAAHGNIHQHLDLIAGLPYEDFESFRNSFDRVYRLRPQELQLGFLKVLRGSAMQEQAEAYGIMYRSAPPYEVLATRWLSWEQLLRLKEVEEMLEVYYNSGQFAHTIAALEPLFERPFALYEGLADFYEENGLNGKSWSRQQRFCHLRKFARQRHVYMDGGSELRQCDYAAGGQKNTAQSLSGEETAAAKRRDASESAKKSGFTLEEALARLDEYLTLDVYLRENAKSRPQWAEDPAVYREAVVRFYRREEAVHEYLPAYAGMTWKQMMRMTHLEHFRYDVMGNGGKRENWLLFDYRRRNPLTGDAETMPVQVEMGV